MKSRDLNKWISGRAGFVTMVVNPCTAIGYVVVYDRKKGFDADTEFRWVTVCERHGTMVSSRTLKLAKEAMGSVDFCNECQRSQHTHFYDYGEDL